MRSEDGAARRLANVVELLVFAIVPVVLLGLVPFDVGGAHATYAWDFHSFWQAAANVAHGRSPYADPPVSPAGVPNRYLYPPLAAELLVPLGLLPFLPAAVAFVGLSAVAIAAALWLLGVRDWRCYGAAFLWFPVLHGLRLGTLTPLLLLALAVFWRLRRSSLGALWLGLFVPVKLFLWPLLGWPRQRALALATGFCFVAASWAAVGFAGLTGYPAMVRAPEAVWETDGYGFAAVARAAGLSVATTSVVVLAGALLACAAIAVHSRRLGEGRVLALLVVVACLFSPVDWSHYLILLLVPVALATPRLSPLWLIPLLLWLTPSEAANGSGWRIALALVVAGWVAAATWRLPGTDATGPDVDGPEPGFPGLTA